MLLSRTTHTQNKACGILPHWKVPLHKVHIHIEIPQGSPKQMFLKIKMFLAITMIISLERSKAE